MDKVRSGRVSPPQKPEATTSVRRRNGELQACEPCRKRKLRCDHGFPTCGRCIKRSSVQACIYHPAPLTKGGRVTPTQSSIPTPLSNHINNESAKSSSPSPLPLAPGARPAAIPTPQPSVSESYDALHGTPADPNRTGFLGSSSYSAVVAEINASLGEQHSSQEDGPVASPSNEISEENVRRGAEVLAHLRDLPLISRWIEKRLSLSHGSRVFTPIYKVWLDGLRFFFGVSGYEIACETDLVELSRLVWRNTEKPLKCNGNTTARQWALQATGDNLRFETIGLLFSAFAFSGSYLSPWDPMFNEPNSTFKDRQHLIQVSLSVAGACANLAKVCGQPNELLVVLIYECVSLIQLIKGETSFEAWRCMSESCDYAIALGMHQEKKVDAKTPFFLCELRKRLIDAIYGYDKFLSTHLGRPPRLTYRHCVLQPPLDLDDEEICSEGPALSSALASLDQAGWNTKGRRFTISWRRVWRQLLPVREDILEVAIGCSMKDLDIRIGEIRVNVEATKASLPSWFPRDPDIVQQQVRSMALGPDWRSIDTYMYFKIQGIMRHTDFVLERAIVNRKRSDSAALMYSARALLSSVLQLFSLRDHLQLFAAQLVVWIVFYGIPCAGVLALELLKQDQSADRPSYRLPRSETIQQLSVLISALTTVRPDDGGNYAICQQGLSALQRILDRILAPKTALPDLNAAEEQVLLQSFPPEVATSNDADFLQWLGNVEWEADNWLEHL